MALHPSLPSGDIGPFVCDNRRSPPTPHTHARRHGVIENLLLNLQVIEHRTFDGRICTTAQHSLPASGPTIFGGATPAATAVVTRGGGRCRELRRAGTGDTAVTYLHAYVSTCRSRRTPVREESL